MMNVENKVAAISEHLFSETEASVYAVLDGASVPDLLPALDQYEPDYVCLYRGELEPDMAEVAPYLVQLEVDSEFTNWILEQGWGNHWGIFALSGADIRVLRKHLRSFLTVYDSEGKPLLFRYYDPRVFRVYLPTCNEEELEIIFGPIACYVVEDENPDTILRFQITSGALQLEKISLTKS